MSATPVDKELNASGRQRLSGPGNTHRAMSQAGNHVDCGAPPTGCRRPRAMPPRRSTTRAPQARRSPDICFTPAAVAAISVATPGPPLQQRLAHRPADDAGRGDAVAPAVQAAGAGHQPAVTGPMSQRPRPVAASSAQHTASTASTIQSHGGTVAAAARITHQRPPRRRAGSCARVQRLRVAARPVHAQRARDHVGPVDQLGEHRLGRRPRARRQQQRRLACPRDTGHHRVQPRAAEHPDQQRLLAVSRRAAAACRTCARARAAARARGAGLHRPGAATRLPNVNSDLSTDSTAEATSTAAAATTTLATRRIVRRRPAPTAPAANPAAPQRLPPDRPDRPRRRSSRAR